MIKKLLIVLRDLFALSLVTVACVTFFQEIFNGNMHEQNFPIWGAIILGIIFLGFFIGMIILTINDIKE